MARTRITVLDTYNLTTLSTLCPPIATIYEPPLGETGTVPDRTSETNFAGKQFHQRHQPQQGTVPFLLKKPNSNPAHDCGNVCGTLFSAISELNGVPLLKAAYLFDR